MVRKALFFAHFEGRLCGKHDNIITYIIKENQEYIRSFCVTGGKLHDGQADGEREKRSRRQHEANLIQSANVMSAHLWRGPNDGLPVLKDLQYGEEGVWVGAVCPAEPVSLG